MQAQRKRDIGGKIIEEFYWNGKTVVYVDNRKTEETFEQACICFENPPKSLSDLVTIQQKLTRPEDNIFIMADLTRTHL